MIASVNYFGSVDVFDGLFDALRRGTDPAVVSIVSNSAQMAPLDDSPFVQALLAHDEPEATRIIDEMNSPIVAYLGSKHALGRAIRRRVLGVLVALIGVLLTVEPGTSSLRHRYHAPTVR